MFKYVDFGITSGIIMGIGIGIDTRIGIFIILRKKLDDDFATSPLRLSFL